MGRLALNRGVMLASVAATLMLLGAGSASASQCRVRITAVEPEAYQSGGRQMYRPHLIGESRTHEGVTTGFRAVDGDGFLTFALAVSRWSEAAAGSSGGIPRTARVSRDEVRALRRAMEIGQAYYTRGLEIASTEPRHANLEEIRRRTERKQQLLAEVITVLDEARDPRSADDTVVVDIAWLRLQLARFLPGGDLQSQYRDQLLNDGAPNMLCSPDAASAMIGSLACAAVATAPAQADQVCPDGLSIDAVILPD